MKLSSRRRERRAADRPVIGDTRPCFVCARGTLEFTNRYHVMGASGSPSRSVAAWVCNECPNVVLVRAERASEAIIAAAREIRARANRRLMKARFVRARANRALLKSERRKKPH